MVCGRQSGNQWTLGWVGQSQRPEEAGNYVNFGGFSEEKQSRVQF